MRTAGERAQRLVRARPEAWLVLVAICGASVGCHSSPRPPCENPPPFYVTLDAAARLNPNDAGRSLPTHVQLIRLKAINRVPSTDSNDLWQRTKETLGADLLESVEIILSPGEKTTQGFQRETQANYLLAVGLFRNSIGDSWRAVAPLPPVDPDRCTSQPAPIMQAPGPTDTTLQFHLEEYRIENRTPVDRKSSPTQGRGRAPT